jgi:hypothetical protein
MIFFRTLKLAERERARNSTARSSCGHRSRDLSDVLVAGVWNFISSSRPWPSGVRSIATSTRTSSSPPPRRGASGISAAPCAVVEPDIIKP